MICGVDLIACGTRHTFRDLLDDFPRFKRAKPFWQCSIAGIREQSDLRGLGEFALRIFGSVLLIDLAQAALEPITRCLFCDMNEWCRSHFRANCDSFRKVRV